jgi:hypothetical protein
MPAVSLIELANHFRQPATPGIESVETLGFETVGWRRVYPDPSTV